MRAILKIIFIILTFNYCIKAGNINQNISLTDILLIKDDNFSTQNLIFNDIRNIGYNLTTVTPEDVTIELLNNHRLVILSTANNPNACLDNNMRFRVQDYILAGGKVIIEGGNNGYVAAVFPLYPAFKNKVLKISSWTTDLGGDLIISENHRSSNLANIPNELSEMIQIDFTDDYDQDVCVKGEGSELFYKTSLYDNNAGVIVAPSVANPQIINFCFNYAAANRSSAKNLLTNSIYNLIGTSVAINNNEQNIPANFNLYQNYPNPFNPITKINYDLPISNHVSLKVFNILGEEITTLVNEIQRAGKYSFNWDASDYSSGVYYYTIHSANLFSATDNLIIETKKMLLVK